MQQFSEGTPKTPLAKPATTPEAPIAQENHSNSFFTPTASPPRRRLIASPYNALQKQTAKNKVRARLDFGAVKGPIASPSLKRDAELRSAFEAWQLVSSSEITLEPMFYETKEALINVANNYGYQCQDVAEDGNCFYHAVADQLDKGDGSSIKEHAFNYFIHNMAHYAAYFSEDSETFIDKVLNGEWADHVFIDATAKALQVTIAILPSDGVQPTFINKKANQPLIVLGHEVVMNNGIREGLHYQSLKKDEHLTPIISLEELMMDEPDDTFSGIPVTSKGFFK